MNQSMSNLSFYSIGIVAANKPLDSNDIEVVPIEKAPMLHGELTDNIETYKAQGSNASGESFNLELKTTATIKATWTPMGNPNRITAPDVRRGEKVMLYRFADADQFWWTLMEQDRKTRRLETVVFGISNNKEENKKDDANSMYYLEASTHKSLIHLQTTRSNGEKYSYTFQINAKEGALTISDDTGNYFTIDSDEKTVKLHNAMGTFIELRGKSIIMSADEVIQTKSQGFSVDASQSAAISSPSNSIDGATSISGTSGGGSGITFDNVNINNLYATNITSPNKIDAPGTTGCT